MKTQILVSIDKNGLRDISLIAETEEECGEVLKTYQKFEPEILNFLSAMRKKAETKEVNSFPSISLD